MSEFHLMTRKIRTAKQALKQEVLSTINHFFCYCRWRSPGRLRLNARTRPQTNQDKPRLKQKRKRKLQVRLEFKPAYVSLTPRGLSFSEPLFQFRQATSSATGGHEKRKSKKTTTEFPYCRCLSDLKYCDFFFFFFSYSLASSLIASKPSW